MTPMQVHTATHGLVSEPSLTLYGAHESNIRLSTECR